MLKEVGRWLGIGLAGFVNVFNPEVVVIGGGAMGSGGPMLERAREEIQMRARSPGRDLVEVKGATLGSDSGVIGAVALAKEPSGEYLL